MARIVNDDGRRRNERYRSSRNLTLLRISAAVVFLDSSSSFRFIGLPCFRVNAFLDRLLFPRGATNCNARARHYSYV